MVLNISGLVQGTSVPVVFSDVFIIPEAYHLFDSKVIANLTATLSYVDDSYRLSGYFTAEFLCSCDKCLKPFSYPVKAEVCERFCLDTGTENDEIWTFTGKEIDFRPALESAILLVIPLKTVCSDGCKGLCFVCGHDLNQGECGCEQHHIDPRFEGLRSLFKDEEV